MTFLNKKLVAWLCIYHATSFSFFYYEISLFPYYSNTTFLVILPCFITYTPLPAGLPLSNLPLRS